MSAKGDSKQTAEVKQAAQVKTRELNGKSIDERRAVARRVQAQVYSDYSSKQVFAVLLVQCRATDSASHRGCRFLVSTAAKRRTRAST